jgi:heterodisulfide reductase subunit D
LKIENKKVVDEIIRCSRCGYCREMIYPQTGTYKICPIYELRRWESYTARGRIAIARAILDGKLKYDERLVERVYSDLLCGNCKEHCGPGVDTLLPLRAMREDIASLGLEPAPIKEVNSNLEKTYNVFGENASGRTDWAKKLNLSEKGNVLYFAGCYDSFRYPKTARSVATILKEGGISLGYLGQKEWCCGIPQLVNGQPNLAEKMMKHNAESIRDSGAETVVASCAGCYHALKSEYPKVLGKLPYKVVHVSEVIANLLKEGKIKLDNAVDKTITYHDPCHLGRQEGVYDPPRYVLKSVSKLKLVEMLRNRENAWCCGGGGGATRVAYPRLTAEIADTRVHEAQDVKASAIVTSCPLCVNVLAIAAEKKNLKVYDLPTVIAEAMGLKV